MYKITTIGSQTWMAENLRYIPSNGRPLTCLPDMDLSNYIGDVCEKYGYFYSWAEAVDSLGEYVDKAKCENVNYGTPCKLFEFPIRGNCPKGWHLPSKSEFAILFFLSGKCDLVAQKGWSYEARCMTLPDSLGFSLLPSGSIVKNYYTNGDDTRASFWTSSPDTIDNAYYTYKFGQAYSVRTLDGRNLEFYKDSLYSGGYATRYPIRCVKDKE